MTRRWLAPQVIQTSAMDCGPAALKCLLEGFGVPVSYGRLREACQTDVDGTSIDTMEEIGGQLGLDCEQLMVPIDHLLLPEADLLPAILIVRLPSGFTHFVVVWRRHGPFVQIMDPATGRRWVTVARLLEETFVHSAPIAADSFREWAHSDAFVGALRARLRRLGCEKELEEALGAALSDPGWRAMATLDAAIRMTQAVVTGGGIARGREASRVVVTLARAAAGAEAGAAARIPETYFTARPVPAGGSEAAGEEVLLRGAVLVRVRRKSKAATADPDASFAPSSPDLVAALTELPTRAGSRILALLHEDGVSTMPLLAVALGGAVLGAALEAVLFRGLLDVGRSLGLVQQRLVAMGVLILFALLLLALELPVTGGVQRLGRRLEVRLRMAFLAKIPRMGDRYFQSRATSDMAERSHAVHEVRLVPELGAQLLRSAAELLVTTAGIVWIDPASAPLAVAAAGAALLVPLAAQPAIAERDLRARSHLGALGRFYLDALLGLAPVRTHGAQRAVRREHEMLLVEWTRAARALLRATVTTEAVQTLAAYALTVPLLLGYLARSSQPAGVLLLLYWALNLPLVGQDLAATLRQYPAQRNRTLRLLEPLGAPEESAPASVEPVAPRGARGVSLRFEGVSVVAGGHGILEGVDLTIAAGEHVAIVGASGAGKSTLLGLLLGWHRAATGSVHVDDVLLDPSRVEAVRAMAAWLEPAVHLWNRSLLENLRYGAARGTSLAPLLEAADLHEVLAKLPDGLQTPLGEGGALVSGGEGQRVRFGRALARKDARLVLLDEPFRGLDRGRRHALLARARAWWRASTMICVTHDISETISFDRVLVIDAGRLVEQGTPAELAARPDSRYGSMLAEEERLRTEAWSGDAWRRLRLDAGRLRS